MIQVYYMKGDGKLSEAAHAMLRRVLQEEYGLPPQALCFGTAGKPYLPAGPYFSISHTRGMAAVAIAQHPVGIDLEFIRSVKETVISRVLSAPELRRYRMAGEQEADFFRLWTLKESYYKYLGTGLPGYPNKTDFVYDQEWRLNGSAADFRVFEDDGFVTALCSGNAEPVSRFFL